MISTYTHSLHQTTTVVWHKRIGIYCCFASVLLMNSACSSKNENFRPGAIKGFNACYEKGLEAGQVGAVWQADLCQDKEAFYQGYRYSERQKAEAAEKTKLSSNFSKEKNYDSEKQKGIAAYKCGDFDAFNRNQTNAGFKAGWQFAEAESKRNRQPSMRELGEIAFENGDYAALEKNNDNESFYRGWQIASDRIAGAEAKQSEKVIGRNYLEEKIQSPEMELESVNELENTNPSPRRQPIRTSDIVRLMERAMLDAEEERESRRIPDEALEIQKEIVRKHIIRAASSINMDPDEFVKRFLYGK